MGDMGEIFDAMRALDRERRERNLNAADASGWTTHTPYHWSREFKGSRLDYWPSRNKWRFLGRVMTGDVNAWMRKRGDEG